MAIMIQLAQPPGYHISQTKIPPLDQNANSTAASTHTQHPPPPSRPVKHYYSYIYKLDKPRARARTTTQDSRVLERIIRSHPGRRYPGTRQRPSRATRDGDL